MCEKVLRQGEGRCPVCGYVEVSYAKPIDVDYLTVENVAPLSLVTCSNCTTQFRLRLQIFAGPPVEVNPDDSPAVVATALATIRELVRQRSLPRRRKKALKKS